MYCFPVIIYPLQNKNSISQFINYLNSFCNVKSSKHPLAIGREKGAVFLTNFCKFVLLVC